MVPFGFEEKRFLISGNFDLDSNDSQYMEIIMGKEDKKIQEKHNGLVLYDYNEKKSRETYIKIVLKPIK